MKTYLVAFMLNGRIETNTIEMDNLYFPSSDNMLALKVKLRTCDAWNRRIFTEQGKLVGSFDEYTTGKIIAVSCLTV